MRPIPLTMVILISMIQQQVGRCSDQCIIVENVVSEIFSLMLLFFKLICDKIKGDGLDVGSIDFELYFKKMIN